MTPFLLNLQKLEPENAKSFESPAISLYSLTTCPISGQSVGC